MIYDTLMKPYGFCSPSGLIQVTLASDESIAWRNFGIHGKIKEAEAILSGYSVERLVVTKLKDYCTATTIQGIRCKKLALPGNDGHCAQHTY